MNEADLVNQARQDAAVRPDPFDGGCAEDVGRMSPGMQHSMGKLNPDMDFYDDRHRFGGVVASVKVKENPVEGILDSFGIGTPAEPSKDNPWLTALVNSQQMHADAERELGFQQGVERAILIVDRAIGAKHAEMARSIRIELLGAKLAGPNAKA